MKLQVKGYTIFISFASNMQNLKHSLLYDSVNMIFIANFTKR